MNRTKPNPDVMVGRGRFKVQAERLRDAIAAHRERWQESNGTNLNNARPADLELWAVLDDVMSRGGSAD